jgi:drug/metabolite transporter (DMT)-like permease
MLQSHLGEIAALATAICWTITAVAFESAGKKIGSLSVNYIRLVIAFFLIGIFTLYRRGMFLPLDASWHNWLWLFVSGFIGFVIGDLFLFQAYVEIGSRISLLIMSSVPLITAVAGFFIMGERITPLALAGMIIAVGGIAFVILGKKVRNPEAVAASAQPAAMKVGFTHPVKGIAYAFVGALGQAFGLIFSKKGMGSYDPFAATQIRVIAAILGFTVVITAAKKWGKLYYSLRDRKSMGQVTVGSIFGPFLGVSFSLLAVQHTASGIVSTITAISPILIIPVSVIAFKEKVLPREILGACITIAGVVLLFI